VASDSIHTVFISSTFEDLREERAEVQKAILRLGCLPLGMELFPSADDDAWGFIKGEIERSDYYILILGGKYGSVAEDGISFTEKEYRYAKEKNKPRLVFVRSNTFPVTQDKLEQDEGKRKRLRSFSDELNEGRLAQRFENLHHLALLAYQSLNDQRQRNPLPGYVRSDLNVDHGDTAKLEKLTTSYQHLITQNKVLFDMNVGLMKMLSKDGVQTDESVNVDEVSEQQDKLGKQINVIVTDKPLTPVELAKIQGNEQAFKRQRDEALFNERALQEKIRELKDEIKRECEEVNAISEWRMSHGEFDTDLKEYVITEGRVSASIYWKHERAPSGLGYVMFVEYKNRLRVPGEPHITVPGTRELKKFREICYFPELSQSLELGWIEARTKTFLSSKELATKCVADFVKLVLNQG
jgi:hypothetical protein